MERTNTLVKQVAFGIAIAAIAFAGLLFSMSGIPYAQAWADESPSIGDAPSLSTDTGSNAAEGGITAQGAASSSELAPAAVSQHVAAHTQAEIRAFITAHPFNMSKAATYAVQPRTSSPYQAGQLSSTSEQEALNALNTMRYIAGLPADVTIDASYRSKAQAGALVNAVNGSLEHFPKQPSGMPSDLYQLGYSGDSSSNIASGLTNPADTIMAYMDDYGTENHGVAGHRVWLLDWNMGKTGFGQVSNYSATYVFDRSRTTSYTDVTWPAANMPTCFFDKSSAWSFLADSGTFSNVDKLVVSVARNRGSKTWSFTKPVDPSTASGGALTGDFFATKGGTGTYAGYQKILFYPSGIDSIQDGDVYSVLISDGTTSKVYTVSFFDLYKPNAVTVYDDSGGVVSPGKTVEEEAGSYGTFYASPSFAEGTLPLNEGLRDLAMRTLSNYSVSWSSSNTAVAPLEQSAASSYIYDQSTGEWLSVTSRADVSFGAVGSSDITASLANGAASSFKVKVRGLNLANAEVSGVDDQVYDGTRKTPAPVVTYGFKTLTPGTDYTLQYGENTQVGEGTVTVVGRGNYEGSKTVRFAIEAASPGGGGGSGGGGTTPGSSSQVMYRLYNPWSGEHFYTADPDERDQVAAEGWDYEGEGWTAPTSGDPVYRLYNSYAGDHHYTLSAEERDNLVGIGWDDEGVGWYSDPNESEPLYREYNPFMDACNHNYSTDWDEHMGLVDLGWHDEGIGWYGV